MMIVGWSKKALGQIVRGKRGFGPYQNPNRQNCGSDVRPHGSFAIGFVAVAAVVLTISPAVHRPRLSLVWNVSPSVPLGLYRVVPATKVRTGDMVAVRPPRALAEFMDKRRYVELGALLIKPVAATSGARICRHKLIVTIDGVRAAKALREDRIHRALPSWSGCRIVARNQLFLIAPAKPDSFDSRYFGPIDKSAIAGRAIPLWTWH